jgi:hypothetical protein
VTLPANHLPDVQMTYMYVTPTKIRRSAPRAAETQNVSSCIFEKSNKRFINTIVGRRAGAYVMYVMYVMYVSNGKQLTSARLAVGS